MDFSKFTQIIGCAYTYEASRGMRKKLTKRIDAHHSSQYRDFSYFLKGNIYVESGQNLRLLEEEIINKSVPKMSSGQILSIKEQKEIHKEQFEKNPELSKSWIQHWPEAELAIILGKEHQIIGYTLANDFTAINIEALGRTENFDGTYFGKLWPGSCSLGPRILTPDEINVNDIDIGLKIQRIGEERPIYDHKYNTKKRKRDFKDLPQQILEYYNSTFVDNPPPSKKIQTENCFLPTGTVILPGTGLISPKRSYSREGDIITIYSPKFGKLENRIG